MRKWNSSVAWTMVATAALWNSAATVHAQNRPQPAVVFSGLAGENLNDRAELVDAIQKFQNRDYTGALDALNGAAGKYPDLPPGRTLLARLHFLAGQTLAGQGQLEQAATDQPDDPESYVLLGDVAFSSGRIVESSLLFEKAAALAGSYGGDAKRKLNLESRCRAGMASVAEARRDWAGAKSQLDSWLQLDPENALAHHRLGAVLFQLDPKNKDAVKHLELAAQKSDKLPPYPITMVRLYEQSGNREESTKWAKFAVSKLPDNLLVRLGVARWAWETDQLDMAKENADKAAELDANSLDAKILRGVIARFQGQLEEAEKLLDAAKLQEPGNFTATDQLALVLIDSSDEAKRRRSLELAELNARNNNQSVEAAWTLGWIYYRWGKLREAAQLMSAAAANGRLSPDAAYYMARLSKDLGQAENVRKFLDAALAANGPFANRAEAKRLQGELPQATGGTPPAATPPAQP